MIASYLSISKVVGEVPALPPNIREGEHLIGAFAKKAEGPTLIVVSGLHGNERSGVFAAARVAQRLQGYESRLRGRVYLVAGNTRALLRGRRFIDADLNRHWTNADLGSQARSTAMAENLELRELQTVLDHILVTARDEVYVLDLHSTSAAGKPFATIGDTLRNRRFAQQFRVSILLGIEEQLEGTMLEFLNNLGAVTLGFEGGQHDSAEAIDNHEALVMSALKFAGILSDDHLIKPFENKLALTAHGPGIYEVRYRHAIEAVDVFTMSPGFNNFDPIRAGTVLAFDRNGPIRAQEKGVVMMPLYQKLGADGFFLARRVSRFWLWVSWVLRKARFPALISLLPGVSLDENDPYSLIVDTRIARLLPLQVFHLLGFRKRRWDGNRLTVSRRRHDTTSPFITR